MAIMFEPPPSTSGSQMPIGSASAIAIKGRLHAGSLPYSVWKPSSERFISEPTKPATNPSGISHPYSPSGSWPMVPKSSTGRRPKQYFDTKSAVRDAAVAPIRIAGEKLRCTPSKANIMPDSGALNAAAGAIGTARPMRRFGWTVLRGRARGRRAIRAGLR